VEGWQQEVRVRRLRAPQSVWDQLGPQHFEAVINLSPKPLPLEPGTYSVPVDVSVVGLEQATILEIEPEWVEVTLEAMRERLVPVIVEVRGEPDLGYQADEPIVVSDTVKARGPASQADQVVQAMTSISLQGVRDTVEEEAAVLTPVDIEGKRVDGVVLEPDRVQVRVPVKQQSKFKQMTVRPEILGQPDPDYYIDEVHINPSTVMVLASSASIFDDLPGFLTTVPISIEGRTEDVVERLSLELPPGVAIVDPSEPAVQVTIGIEPFLDSVTVTRTVTFQGLQPGLMANASPQVVEMILSGPRPRLSALLPEDVRVILDLSNLQLGDQEQLEPVVVQPEGITVDSIIPAVIQVEIVRDLLATPES
jgi:YbbR domain-containing protein